MVSASETQLGIVYVLVVIYALCYQLQSPLEPFLVETLVKGTDASVSYARLQSFFSFVQMVGSFIVGYLLDIVGLRGMFALNFAACAATYALLASATSIEMLFASKLPAMFQAGFLCAQAAAAKLTPDSGPERTTALGRLTSAYTVGGVIGPALGGMLGTQAAAKLAVAGSIMAIGLVSQLSPAMENSSSKKADEKQDKLDGRGGSWRASMRKIVPLVWPLLLSKMASGLVNSAVQAVRPLVLKNDFHFDQSKLGTFMSAMFFGNALLGLFLGRITSAFGGAVSTVIVCYGAMSLGYGLMALLFEHRLLGLHQWIPSGGVWLFMGLTLAMSLFQFPLATTLTSLSTSRVSPSLKGTLVGAEHATFALAGLIGPAVGVALLDFGRLPAVAASGGLLYAVLFGLWRALATQDTAATLKADVAR